MRLLAMDAALSACSAAIWDDGVITASRRAPMARGHAEALIPMLAAVLRDAGCGAAAVDAVAVTIGPGSFTGLRVGVAAARGIALVAGVPCFGVSTLEAAAAKVIPSLRDARALLVVLDSKRIEVYAQLFATDGVALGPMLAIVPTELASRLPCCAIAVAGDAATAVAPLLAGRGFPVVATTGSADIDAAAVAGLAARRWARGERPADGPSPLYLRPPDAARPAVGGRRRV